jgi:hypothetical protein
MSDEEFLARWSRRKREAKAGHAVPGPTEPVEANSPVPSAGTAEPANPEFDLSSLPPIESIAAATDVTAFLRDGVPQELRRAALRRAWAADPAIRDFVGLAENAWDFNDPNSMPGFGSLEYSAEQLEALVLRVVGGVAQAAEDLPNALGEAENVGQSAGPGLNPAQESSAMETIASLRTPEEPQITESQPPVPAAPQPATAEKVEREERPVQHRTHGGALPR